MKKMALLAALSLMLTGCAALEVVYDAFYPDPTPVCEEGAAGVKWEGLGQCVKLSNGTYRWR